MYIVQTARVCKIQALADENIWGHKQSISITAVLLVHEMFFKGKFENSVV
jgi:hypothetical protein